MKSEYRTNKKLQELGMMDEGLRLSANELLQDGAEGEKAEDLRKGR